MLHPHKRTELEKELIKENKMLKIKIKQLQKKLAEYEEILDEEYIDFNDDLWFLR